GDNIFEHLAEHISVMPAFWHDGAHRIGRKKPGKDRQSLEGEFLGLGQQLVTPVEGFIKRLVPWHCATPAAPTKPEPPIEKLRRLCQTVLSGSAHRDFDRQRHAIERMADFDDHRRIYIAETCI